jgi:aryl-alcohol dehydrogenase-like predicted oxidoreductase
VLTPLGLGLAALGRPGYITVGHATDLPARDVAAMERHCHDVLDAAWAAGIRWFDAARSYGRAEDFLASWLAARAIAPADVTVSSKWGYRYTANWQVTAAHHEIKDHSLAALDEQWPESQARLGPYLRLYQVHSATLESGILDDARVLDRLAALRDSGVVIGLSVSGPGQRETIERALAQPVWSSVQVTWNLLERAAEPALRAAKAAGWRVMLKEALANGRLVRDAPPALREEAGRLGTTCDAVALAAARAQPFADLVLSGAVTQVQVRSNAYAVEVDLDALASLVVPPEAYWQTRAQLPWN